MPFWINTIVAIIAFAITALSGFFLIPYLRKVKAGQTILDIGPNWHKSKQGTPTMGGFMFVVGTLTAIVTGFALLRTFYQNDNMHGAHDTAGFKLLTGFVMALLFMLVGFVDDYIKVVKREILGFVLYKK